MPKQDAIVIRPLRPDDLEDLYAIASDPVVIQTMVMLPGMEFSETRAWYERKPAGSNRLVAEVDGKAVGSCGLTQSLRPRMTHSASLGLMVHSDYWGRGIGTALMAAQMELADNWLNLLRIELDVFTNNPAAIHLYEKFGFAIEGTKRRAIFGGDGRFHDEHIMSRIKEPPNRHRPSNNPPAMGGKRKKARAVEIRPVHPDDAADIYELRRHPLICRGTLQIPSASIVSTLERVKQDRPDVHTFAAVTDGRVVGNAALHVNQNPRLIHSGGIGMMVHPDFWGQGIGGQLMAALIDIADNWLNLSRVELDVNIDNPAAIKLYEKFRFEIEGTRRLHTFGDGRWADSYFMARVQES